MNLKRHILPAFRRSTVGARNRAKCRAWVRKLSLTLAPTTVEVIYRQLSMIFKSAVRDGLLVVSPCREIRLPRIERKQIVPLTVEQVQSLDALPRTRSRHGRLRRRIGPAARRSVRPHRRACRLLATHDPRRSTTHLSAEQCAVPRSAQNCRAAPHGPGPPARRRRPRRTYGDVPAR